MAEQTQIEIKPPQPAHYSDAGDDQVLEQQVRFFKSGTRKREDSWVISLFVVLHIVAFAATMFVNDCWQNSHRDCAIKVLGRLSFQPLWENPLLGPSSSTLDEMGALQQTFLANHHQTWRLFTCLWLHAGAIHLIINLSSVIFVGIHLEQEFGPLRIGMVYILSAFFGSLVAALFLQKSPAVGSSGALFGLLGSMLSGLICNWKVYTDKLAALSALLLVAVINFALGLLPYVDNFSNLGGFISGVLLGFVLLFSPRLPRMTEKKGGFFDYGVKKSIRLKQKFNRPVLRSVSFVLFGLVLAGAIVAVLHGIDMNKYCSWCQYINCVPSNRWSCNTKVTACQTMENAGRLTVTCMGKDNFRVFPFTSFSETRLHDLCDLICS
ncbi:RHOMBOID-like protein 8 [Vitis riparia]|uniref:RHOMBOID-like protein 8 n=1 Tax=Vitis riparia TaxID=96939 RepID=UPI00155AEF33|nr:RHOMBOID-like protein 8 [Vitis riparia]XP_034677113.1 RHOMBOID-like protein 8 [Vitis riparia]